MDESLLLARLRMRRRSARAALPEQRRWTRPQRRVSKWTPLLWVRLLRLCHRSHPAWLLSRSD
jgi:hypothetical protein